jgi:hypothetical protein
VLIVGIAVLTIEAFAWQVGLEYGHSNRFGGEADSGWHRGNIEVGTTYRDVRAGGDHVTWGGSQLLWWDNNGDSNNRPAMVFHAFKRSSNQCGDIRVGNLSWSWSDFPGWTTSDLYTKRAGCLTGADNEIRFLIYDYSDLVEDQDYYFQHIFQDTKFNGSVRGEGKITADTYHDRWSWHNGVTQDYRQVFCVPNNSDTAGTCW